MKKLKIKVCGMKHAANIAAVADLHPDYMGFIFYPKSPRYVNDVSAELVKYIPDSIKTTGVFVNEYLEVLKSRVLKHKLKAVQLHGNEDVSYCNALKETGIEVIKAFGIDAHFDFKHLEGFSSSVDYFLFDTQTPAHGGSGKVFDWRLLAKYKLNKPYFLSGGITLTHAESILKIKNERLYAIDVNSKFELEPGMKDVDKLNEFFEKIN